MESVKQAQTLDSTEIEHQTYIDMMLNPEKLNQYRIDVDKAEKDIRAEQQ